MNPQILFNSSLALVTTGLIFLFKGMFLIGFATITIALGTSIFWFMSGFFGKFEYESTHEVSLNEKDEEGKGVLKPF